jgi:signal transduction histidine kinase
MLTNFPDANTVTRAAEIFVTVAYPAGPPPSVRTVLDKLRNWTEAAHANPVLVASADKFRPSFALRLGNIGYPHSKMLIESWPQGSKFFFRVDSHDKHVAVAPDHPEYAALTELRKRNQHFTEAIENTWRDAGLPTFASCLTEDLAKRSGKLPEAAGDRKPRTVLVVDDEPEVVKSVKNLLRLDYKVLGATSVAEVTEILAREEIHVIMSDQNMPDVTGVELLRDIREKHPNAVRLLATGYADIRSVIDAINRGNVYRYISKPWDPDDLQAIIRDACAHHDLIVERDELLETLKKNNEELKLANELKSGFIKVASHEFRTPVAILVGLSKLALHDHTLSESARENLTQIDGIAGRMQRLVHQTLSMLIAGKFDAVFHSQPHDLQSELESCIMEIRPFIEARRQTLEMKIQHVGLLSYDEEKLRDCVNHLLLNAIKFTPDGGRIGLKAHRDGERITIEISDTGDGIAPDALPRLFDPFFTGFDVSRHSSGVYQYGTRGLGLGLSVVKAFTEMHGGKIDVQSQLGRGSTFRIFLPDKANATHPIALAA